MSVENQKFIHATGKKAGLNIIFKTKSNMPFVITAFVWIYYKIVCRKFDMLKLMAGLFNLRRG